MVICVNIRTIGTSCLKKKSNSTLHGKASYLLNCHHFTSCWVNGACDCVEQNDRCDNLKQTSWLMSLQRKRGVLTLNKHLLSLGKKVHIRKPALSTPEVVPERKRSTPINPANTIRKCLSSNPVSQRPFRDRIIHLLALRSYKKLEVLARLQRDGINQKDRNSLGTTLQQVL